MKECPKCSVEYIDNTLEFCLQDGERLRGNPISDVEMQTVESDKANNPLTTADTEVLPRSKIPAHFGSINAYDARDYTQSVSPIDESKPASLKEQVTNKGYRLIEITPIVLALAHNYWQWIFFDKSNFRDILSFLLSGTFIVWFLLLFLALITGALALTFGKNKGFAVTALVILAINLLLSIVPLK